MSFTPIGDAIAAKQSGDSTLKQQANAGNVMTISEHVFADVFGEQGKEAIPQFLKNRTLTVSCTSSAMAGEIRLNQDKIVKAINKALGEKLVDRIRYLV